MQPNRFAHIWDWMCRSYLAAEVRSFTYNRWPFDTGQAPSLVYHATSIMQPMLRSLVNLTNSHKRLLAAGWFAALALLCVAVMFHRVTMSLRGAVLYVFLPVIAAGIAGGLWGVPILNRAKTSTVGQSLMRGIAVSGGAFVIFSVMFALVLPFVERGWSLQQFKGLLLFTWTLGLLLAGPIVLFGGMLAGATLYLFRRRVVGE